MKRLSHPRERKELVRICRRLCLRGLASSDGNASMRLRDGSVLISPSGIYKCDLEPTDLVLVDMKGGVLEGRHRPSTEIAMHLAAYRLRDDVCAVIHAHPLWTTACTVAGIRLDRPVLPEVEFHLGTIPTIPYATPSSKASAAAIGKAIRAHNLLVLDRHGVLAVGGDIEAAYMRIEKVEHLAQVVLTAKMAGRTRTLRAADVEALARLRKELNYQGRFGPPRRGSRK